MAFEASLNCYLDASLDPCWAAGWAFEPVEAALAGLVVVSSGVAPEAAAATAEAEQTAAIDSLVDAVAVAAAGLLVAAAVAIDLAEVSAAFVAAFAVEAFAAAATDSLEPPVDSGGAAAAAADYHGIVHSIPVTSAGMY